MPPPADRDPADLASPAGVTVVLPTRDRVAQLSSCLASLRSALRPGDDIVVVDSASADAVAVRATATGAGATVLRCDQPGVARARNAGWRAARHEVVLFVDDDVVVDVGWRDALATAVMGNPRVGFVTGRILPPVGQTPSRDVAIKRDEHVEEYDATSVGNLGHSASLGMRRAVLERIGGFDEAMGAGARFKAAPDIDLFDRCFAAGFTGRYEPAALAWHEQWRGPRRLLALEARYGYGNGARIAKLARTDPARGRLVRRDAVISWGLREIGREARARHGYPTAGAAIRLAATCLGYARARGVPVLDGHFRPRGSS